MSIAISSHVKYLYKALVPQKLRHKIRSGIVARRENKRLSVVKQSILDYYAFLPKERVSSEIAAVLSYLKKNPIHVFPYEFQKQFKPRTVNVFFDSSNELRYVMHEGRRLYFKKSWQADRIKDYYAFLCAEQHPDSPHRYLTASFDLAPNSIVADAGAAEGIFALGLMDAVRHLYLFESDPEWIESLNETYKPWRDKVTVINNFVSNRDDARNISLDFYFKDKAAPDFLKVDVDGAETELLEGAANLLDADSLQLALCVYHRPQDEKLFSSLLESKGFSVVKSKGYMLFYFEGFVEPYLRRGLIRASKSQAPKVSICIPCYKQIGLLEKCIDSVLMQDFDDYEIIVSDDTPDNSVKEMLDKKDCKGKLRYYHNPVAAGTPENWNMAVRKGVGDYIKVLHHDDSFTEKHSLRKLVALMEDHPGGGFGFCATKVWNVETNETRTHCCSQKWLERVRREPNFLFFGNMIGAPSTTIYSRQLGLDYDKHLKWLVDVDFYIRAIKRSTCVKMTSEILVCTADGAQGQVTRTLANDKSVQIREHVILFEKLIASSRHKSKYALVFDELFTRYDVSTLKDLENLTPVSSSSRSFFNKVFRQKEKGPLYKKVRRRFYRLRFNI